MPETAAAAIRAGIVRVGEHEVLVDAHGEPLRVAQDAKLDPDVPHGDRMLTLGAHCLRLLAERLPLHPSVMLPLLLSLPEPRPGFSAADERRLEQRIAGPSNGLRLQSVRTVARGHAGALQALQIAAQLVARSPDGLCVVGGIDSHLEPSTLRWLSSNRRLVEEGSRSGFFPGEGACFAVVASHATRRALGLPSLAVIRSIGIAHETRVIGGELDNLGHGLTDAVMQACGALGGRRIDRVYCDINGERYRTEEWGFATLRTSQWLRDPADYVAPARQWGDLGAATGTALACLAIAAWQRGYARGPLAMLVAGSDAGLRGALVLEQEAS